LPGHPDAVGEILLGQVAQTPISADVIEDLGRHVTVYAKLYSM
jgi:hypothetical protein